MVTVYWPGNNFITVSVTGQNCQLMCKHCQGRFLKHMAATETPEELWDLALESKAKGINGMLISGGSNSTGAVPILPYLDIIKNIKEELNMSINLHTGLIAIEDIPKLVEKGVDVISFDVVGSPAVVKKVYGVDIEPDYYEKALSEFRKCGLKVVPHITVGLDRGNDSGEKNALEIIVKYEPHFVVINALMSSEGSDKAARRLIDVLRQAREIMPNTAIGIGCMRPRGQIVDPDLLMELGISVMALPSKDLVQQLRSLGVNIVEKDGCCAFF